MAAWLIRYSIMKHSAKESFIPSVSWWWVTLSDVGDWGRDVEGVIIWRNVCMHNQCHNNVMGNLSGEPVVSHHLPF